MADDEFLGILFCIIYLKPGDQETSNLEMATNTEKKKSTNGSFNRRPSKGTD